MKGEDALEAFGGPDNLILRRGVVLAHHALIVGVRGGVGHDREPQVIFHSNVPKPEALASLVEGPLRSKRGGALAL